MIIKRLEMHNFGVYAGDNQFVFEGDKPIVLIGGMNGKTGAKVECSATEILARSLKPLAELPAAFALPEGLPASWRLPQLTMENVARVIELWTKIPASKIREEEFKRLSELDSPLAAELEPISLYDSQTVRLNDANIYKCTHSSFVDRGFHHSFYLVEMLTQEVFKAEKKAYEKVIRMIAHEVNNTTAGITSTLDTLEATFSEMQDTEDICEVLRVSIERCYSMSHFITNFADVVRIPEPQTKTQPLNAVVFSCKRIMETICLNRNIRIVMELDSVSPIVNLDNSLFEQVLVNIIKNASEAIGHDGEIYIRTSRNPVCLEIADTGKGIDKETEAKLFSPFFSTKRGGQGIGLIFVREVLQKHNYSFSLRTYADGLTRFRILFE